MLQRIVLRPPTPLKPYPNDGVIFNREGKLREHFNKLCLEININPGELYPRTLESFGGPNVIKNVQILKFNNYENKRRAKIEALRTVARQRNIPVYSKLPRADTQSPPVRQESGVGMDSMSNIDKDLQRLGQSGLRESGVAGSKYVAHQLQSQGSQQISSFDFTSPALAAVGNGKTKNTDTGRMPSIDEIKGSMSNLDIGMNEFTIADEMEENFKKHMAFKAVHKERLTNASMMVSQKDELHREQMKKAYEEKTKKWIQKREQIKKQKKKNEDEEEYRRERILIQKENQEEAQKQIREKMLAKIAKSELHRKQETEKRLTKLNFLNTTFQERRLYCQEKKEIDESIIPIDNSLIEIENKFYVSETRKRQFIEGKRLEAARHLVGAGAKLQRVREQEKVEEMTKLEKLLSKMEKGRCRSALLTKKRSEAGKRLNDSHEEYLMRMEDKAIREAEAAKHKIDDIKDRERKGILNVQQRRTDVKDLIAERRELWNQKRENIIENKEIANEAHEKYLEQRMKSYRDRVNHIKRMKDDRKKQIEKINKSFTVGGL